MHVGWVAGVTAENTYCLAGWGALDKEKALVLRNAREKLCGKFFQLMV